MEGEQELRLRSTEISLQTPAAAAVRRSSIGPMLQTGIRDDFHEGIAARHGLDRRRHPFFILTYLLGVFTEAPASADFTSILNFNALRVYMARWSHTYAAVTERINNGRDAVVRHFAFLERTLPRLYERWLPFSRTLLGQYRERVLRELAGRAIPGVDPVLPEFFDSERERLVYVDGLREGEILRPGSQFFEDVRRSSVRPHSETPSEPAKLRQGPADSRGATDVPPGIHVARPPGPAASGVRLPASDARPAPPMRMPGHSSVVSIVERRRLRAILRSYTHALALRQALSWSSSHHTTRAALVAAATMHLRLHALSMMDATNLRIATTTDRVAGRDLTFANTTHRRRLAEIIERHSRALDFYRGKLVHLHLRKLPAVPPPVDVVAAVQAMHLRTFPAGAPEVAFHDTQAPLQWPGPGPGVPKENRLAEVVQRYTRARLVSRYEEAADDPTAPAYRTSQPDRRFPWPERFRRNSAPGAPPRTPARRAVATLMRGKAAAPLDYARVFQRRGTRDDMHSLSYTERTLRNVMPRMIVRVMHSGLAPPSGAEHHVLHLFPAKQEDRGRPLPGSFRLAMDAHHYYHPGNVVRRGPAPFLSIGTASGKAGRTGSHPQPMQSGRGVVVNPRWQSDSRSNSTLTFSPSFVASQSPLGAAKQRETTNISLRYAIHRPVFGATLHFAESHVMGSGKSAGRGSVGGGRSRTASPARPPGELPRVQERGPTAEEPRDLTSKAIAEIFRNMPYAEVKVVADRIYQHIERRVMLEQKRRGV